MKQPNNYYLREPLNDPMTGLMFHAYDEMDVDMG
jgi:rhamnogalacturonyl hydrolase YesR